MLKAYKYRLLPTKEQEKILDNWMGACRFIYNLALEVKNTAWKSARQTVGKFELMRQVTELKKTEALWLADCPAQSLESAITNLDNAYKKFFLGGGFPNFKKKTDRQSITFRRYCPIEGNKVRLTKIGWIDFICHRPIADGEIRTIVISKTPTNKYFVSILIKNEDPVPAKKPVVEVTSVGVDMGLKTFAALSDGQIIDNPKFLQHQLKRLKIEQRKLARRFQPGKKSANQSKGWHKQKIIVAKLHEKIANQRNDFLHKASAKIIQEYDTICLETLNVAGMLQNRKLAKSISDVSWSEFARMIEYKADWHGKNVVRIGTFYPSSKTCSSCGHVFKEQKLYDREWDCENCGTHHDRDLNAAKNIKSFGINVNPSPVNVVQKNKRMGCEFTAAIKR